MAGMDPRWGHQPPCVLHRLRVVVFQVILVAGLLAAIGGPLYGQAEDQLVNDIRMFTVLAAINVGDTTRA